MAIKCPQCGAEYDVTLFTFNRSIRCDCGANVDLAVGHQQTSEEGMQPVSPEASRACVSPENQTTVPARRHWGFLWLAIIHIASGIIAALTTRYADPSYDSRFRSSQLMAGIFIGLVFSQTSLLGIWGSLGRSLWWKRVIGVVVGIVYLGSLLGFGVDERNSAVLILVAATTSVVAMPLLIARSMRTAIRRDLLHLSPTPRIQFTIRHLLALMIVVACVISAAKLIRNYLVDGEDFIRLLSLALTFGVVGVLPVWCVMAAKRPVSYSIGLVIVGACAGYYLAQAYSDGVAVWTSAMATEVVAVAVPLLLVRSWGYRLVRLPR